MGAPIVNTTENPMPASASREREQRIREKALEGGQWMVIRKIDTEPVETWIGEEGEMRRVFARAGEQWTETYLLRVVAGPGQPALATPPATEEAK